MRNTKAKAASGNVLVLVLLVILAWASLPMAGIARDQEPPYIRRGPEFGFNSEPVRLSLSVPIVEQVQRALRHAGYYHGDIDGFMGENTQIAIQIFYVDHCYRAAPVITRWLLAQLGIGSEGKSPVSTPSLRQTRYPAID
jgi:peptidoglycan hydrolase-like protein with peptidoglycan-binding domain